MRNSQDPNGRAYVRHGTQGPGSDFAHLSHAPAANTKATVTKAAAGQGVRNVCTALTVSLCGGAVAPSPIQLSVALIDGVSGGTNYLWGPVVMALPATAGAISAIVIGDTWKPGSPNTPMTLEFSVAGGANTIESVDFDVQQALE